MNRKDLLLWMIVGGCFYPTLVSAQDTAEEEARKKAEINEIKLSENTIYADVIEMVTDDNEAVSLAQQKSMNMLQMHVIEMFAKRMKMPPEDVQEIWDVIDDKCQNIVVKKGDLFRVFTYIVKDAVGLGRKKPKKGDVEKYLTPNEEKDLADAQKTLKDMEKEVKLEEDSTNMVAQVIPPAEAPVAVPPAEVPATEVPVTEASAKETTVDEIPAAVAPILETPVKEATVEAVPVKEETVEAVPVKEETVEEVPAAVAPILETPVKETPVQTVPVQTVPVQETPVQEAAAVKAEETPKAVTVPVIADTPKPVVTEAPKPVVTETPKPVVAETPKPVVTEAPKPVVTETPKPVVAETPKPVVTEAPKPVPAPAAAEAQSVPEMARLLMSKGDMKSLLAYLKAEKDKHTLMYGSLKNMIYKDKCYIVIVNKSTYMIETVLGKGFDERMNYKTMKTDKLDNYTNSNYSAVLVQDY